MKKQNETKPESKELTAEEGETVESELYYNQNVTINDNNGTIIFRQVGHPTTPPPKPPGT